MNRSKGSLCVKGAGAKRLRDWHPAAADGFPYEGKLSAAG